MTRTTDRRACSACRAIEPDACVPGCDECANVCPIGIAVRSGCGRQRPPRRSIMGAASSAICARRLPDRRCSRSFDWAFGSPRARRSGLVGVPGRRAPIPDIETGAGIPAQPAHPPCRRRFLQRLRIRAAGAQQSLLQPAPARNLLHRLRRVSPICSWSRGPSPTPCTTRCGAPTTRCRAALGDGGRHLRRIGRNCRRRLRLRDGLDGVLPVDLYLPGCPPNPAAIMEALLMFLERAPQRVEGRPARWSVSFVAGRARRLARRRRPRPVRASSMLSRVLLVLGGRGELIGGDRQTLPAGSPTIVLPIALIGDAGLLSRSRSGRPVADGFRPLPAGFACALASPSERGARSAWLFGAAMSLLGALGVFGTSERRVPADRLGSDEPGRRGDDPWREPEPSIAVDRSCSCWRCSKSASVALVAGLRDSRSADRNCCSCPISMAQRSDFASPQQVGIGPPLPRSDSAPSSVSCRSTNGFPEPMAPAAARRARSCRASCSTPPSSACRALSSIGCRPRRMAGLRLAMHRHRRGDAQRNSHHSLRVPAGSTGELC